MSIYCAATHRWKSPAEQSLSKAIAISPNSAAKAKANLAKFGNSPAYILIRNSCVF